MVEAGKRLVGGRLTPREFDAVVEAERAAWQRRRATEPGTLPPGEARAAASFRG